MHITLPYDHTFLHAELPDHRITATLRPQKPEKSAPAEEQCVAYALSHPIQSPPLHELAKSACRVLILTSDHTRPVPSRIIMPLLLKEIRKGNPDVEIIILVATGCHRASTQEELVEKFGEQIVSHERIVMHDSTLEDEMVDKGILPSGGRLRINRLVDWSDLLVAEGFIEPHFFAGFSGGRKSVLPGIASCETVLYNHCAEFISHPKARTGVLAGNPIHEDMVYGAKKANLKFVVNVALDENKQITGAWAGNFEKAHEAGCSHVLQHARVPPVEADIVLTSNGGYPLDQNVYQAVKCMTAAEACVRQGGVIIVSAACRDGLGGEAFYRQSSQERSPQEILNQIEAIPKGNTEFDQWQTQIFMRVLSKATVIFITDPSLKEQIKKMHMVYSETLENAIAVAQTIVSDGSYVVIPDGVSVIVR